MSRHVTQAKDKIPFFEKVMYGLGSGSFQLAADGVKGLANPIFNITLGLSPDKIGLVLMISRLFDAFTDPLMGKISDDCRSRFGRRRPFIFVGSFLTAIAFCAIWFVPTTWSLNAIFWYYLVAMLVFYLCATIQTVPYHTLGMEMTADFHERTVIAGYKMFFSFIFLLGVPWAFRIAQMEQFGGVLPGMRILSAGFGILIIAGGVLPAIFVKERYYHLASRQKKLPFWTSFRMAFANKPFLILTGIILFSGIGGNMVNALGTYVIFYHIYGGDLIKGSELSAMGTNVFSLCAIACIPVMTWMAGRIGKVKTLKFLIILAVIGSATKFWLYSREMPWLLFISQALVAPLAAGFWTITASMKADICDDDELQHGLRREGIFGSVGNWVMKTTMASTFAIGGMLLVWSGFNIEYKGNQAPETLLTLRILFAAVPAGFSILAYFLVALYPLHERRMQEIREELEARRDSVT